MSKTKHFTLSLFLLLFLLAGCSTNVPTNVARAQLEETLQQLVDESVYSSFDAIPGTALTVFAPALHLNWTGVSGYDSKAKTAKFKINQPFRIASSSKTFVAASILRLHELDSLSIDDAIGNYISEAHQDLLKKGGYDPEAITIRHCLNHTAGLHDYALGSRTFPDRMVANPQKRWTRTEQLTIAMETGTKKGAPGEKYNYCDTGYILLGETLESVLDTTLAAAIDVLLSYEKLGLASTWLESAEPAKIDTLDIAHCYFGKNDATEWDASIDIFGGGGLVSTSQDIAQFMFKLMNDKVFQHTETKELMLSPTVFPDASVAYEDGNYEDYRLGLGEIEVFGEKGYLHEGFWGSFMIYIPARNCAIGGYTLDGSYHRLLKKVWLTLKNIADQNNEYD